MYCIYTDTEIDLDHANSEHIIPLSLGGANGFEIMVDAHKNSDLGTKIDGKLANDFLMAIDRERYGAKGHSKQKSPGGIAKHSKLGGSEKPVQVKFNQEGVQVYSPMDRRYLTDEELSGQEIESRIQLDRYSRMRVTAKIALAAGYFIYSDIFRNNFPHQDLRLLMNFDPSTSQPSDFSQMKITGWFWPFPVRDEDKTETQKYQVIAEYLDCSFVLASPGQTNIRFVVGLLGKVVGVISCELDTSSYPLDGDHDLGHLIAIKDGKIVRQSYRQLAQDTFTYLQSKRSNQ